MIKGVMGQQISYLTVIVVHSTMHVMHHKHCQITIIIILLYRLKLDSYLRLLYYSTVTITHAYYYL